MMQRFTSLLAVTLIAGCAGMDAFTPAPLPVAPGERLRVGQTLHLPADGSRLYIQHGEAGSAREYTVWEHHCSLVARNPGTILPPVAAGTELTVANVQRKAEFGVWERGVINYHTLIRFEAGTHPLQALECELWQHGHDADAYISRTQLQQLLGSVITLEANK